jgi:transcriptional activator protein UGA3
MQLRAFVLGQTPTSINIRYLVRRSLSLLEAMSEQNLPGFCSAHWVIFTTAVNAAPGGAKTGELDDRTRIEKLYDTTM